MYPRWLWPVFAVPGVVWLILLFLVPFYAVIGVAFGGVDPVFQNPIPTWNPSLLQASCRKAVDLFLNISSLLTDSTPYSAAAGSVFVVCAASVPCFVRCCVGQACLHTTLVPQFTPTGVVLSFFSFIRLRA